MGQRAIVMDHPESTTAHSRSQPRRHTETGILSERIYFMSWVAQNRPQMAKLRAEASRRVRIGLMKIGRHDKFPMWPSDGIA